MTVRMIDEGSYADVMTHTVLPALQACRTEGWYDPTEEERAAGLAPLPWTPGSSRHGATAERGAMHYQRYDASLFDREAQDGATATFRGAVVISHGFTEFADKYAELVWYLLLEGYSVCVMEHRGHGRSARDVDGDSLVWIDDWRRYVADLAGFARTIGRDAADGGPLHLFAHSMGGGIGAAVLERHPSLFDKAVLSSPMIAPRTGMPLWFTRLLIGAFCACGQGRRRVIGHHDFDGTLDLSAYALSSEARERWYHALRCAEPCRQSNAAAFDWVRQALKLSRAVLDPRACARIETPILLFQAGRDAWVRNREQDLFVHRVRDGYGTGGSGLHDADDAGDDRSGVAFVRIPESQHEVFSMPNDVYRPYLERILAFYEEPLAL